MNLRQQEILKTLVEEYINLAEPIGSKFLSQKYDWGISAATVRNDLAELDEEGYLEQPHTSAGRVPTDKGYRFFVEALKRERLSERQKFLKVINAVFESVREEHRLFREVARTLSELSGNMGIAGLIGEDEIFKSGMPRLLRQPDFGAIDEFWRFAEDFEAIDRKLCECGEDFCGTRTVRVFIGRENPLAKNEDLSLVISGYENKEGKKGVAAILGPKRMKYDRNISLVQCISELLNKY